MRTTKGRDKVKEGGEGVVGGGGGFFFNDTATTEIYTLSLHDALPILKSKVRDYGRIWDFEGKSADIIPIDWKGPRP